MTLFLPKSSVIRPMYINEKSAQLVVLQLVTLTLAEREGFEPPVPLSTPVFKTGAFDHSAISPIQSDDYSLVS